VDTRKPSCSVLSTPLSFLHSSPLPHHYLLYLFASSTYLTPPPLLELSSHHITSLLPYTPYPSCCTSSSSPRLFSPLFSPLHFSLPLLSSPLSTVPEGGYGEDEDCLNAEDEEYRAVLERMEQDGKRHSALLHCTALCSAVYWIVLWRIVLHCSDTILY
jgi:hypothetical protein